MTAISRVHCRQYSHTMHFHARAYTHTQILTYICRYVGKKARACAHFTHIQQRRKQTHKSIFRHTQAPNVRSMTVLLATCCYLLLTKPGIKCSSTHIHTKTLVNTYTYKRLEKMRNSQRNSFDGIPSDSGNSSLRLSAAALFIHIIYVYTYIFIYVYI